MQKNTAPSRPVRGIYKRVALNEEQHLEIRETLLRDAHEVAHCMGETMEIICSALAGGEITIQVLEDRHGVRCLYLQYEDAWVVAPFAYVH